MYQGSQAPKQGWGPILGQIRTQSLFSPFYEYTITTKLNDNMVLDVSKNPGDNNKLIIWQRHGMENQRFRIQYVNNRYQLMSRNGNALQPLKGQNGAKIHANTYVNGESEFWELEPTERCDEYMIKSFCGKYLDVSNQKDKNGTEVIHWKKNGGKNQKWIIKPIFRENQSYTISTALNLQKALVDKSDSHPELVIWNKEQAQRFIFHFKYDKNRYQIFSKYGNVLSVNKGSNKQGENIILNTSSNSAQQFWEIVPVKDTKNDYMIKSFCGQCMDVKKQKDVLGTDVIQWKIHGKPNQIWRIQQYPLFDEHREYSIRSALNDKMCLDVSGNVNQNNKIIIYEAHGKQNQRFKIKFYKGKYQIISKSGKAVEVIGSSRDIGAKIHANNINHTHSQFWDIQPIFCRKSHHYLIKSHCGYCLDIAGGNAKNSNQIVQWDFNGGQNQTWIIEPVPEQPKPKPKPIYFKDNQQYVIMSALNDKMALDVSGNVAQNNKIIIYESNGQDNQRFHFKHHNGKYQIIPKAGKAVQVIGGSKNKGIKIHANNLKNSPEQYWQIEAVEGKQHHYHIKSHCGHSLDVPAGKATNGNQIVQWDFNGGKNQTWIIKPAK